MKTKSFIFSTSNIKLIIFTGINWSRINDLFTKSPPPFFPSHTHVHPNQMVLPFISFSKLYFSQIHKLSQQKWIFTWVWYKYKRIDFIIFSRVYEWMKEEFQNRFHPVHNYLVNKRDNIILNRSDYELK